MISFLNYFLDSTKESYFMFFPQKNATFCAWILTKISLFKYAFKTENLEHYFMLN